MTLGVAYKDLHQTPHLHLRLSAVNSYRWNLRSESVTTLVAYRLAHKVDPIIFIRLVEHPQGG